MNREMHKSVLSNRKLSQNGADGFFRGMKFSRIVDLKKNNIFMQTLCKQNREKMQTKLGRKIINENKTHKQKTQTHLQKDNSWAIATSCTLPKVTKYTLNLSIPSTKSEEMIYMQKFKDKMS